MSPSLRLYTFSLSHFSEKIRWTMDAARVDYTETRWTPFFHILPALRRGKLGTTVPILQTPQGYIQDSTRILRWLEEHQTGFTLIPQDPALREEVMAIEERFDRIGSHVIRYAHSSALNDPDTIVALWSLDAGPTQARMIKHLFPLLRMAFRRRMRMRADTVARSKQAIAEGLDWLDTRLADGRKFLAGDRLTVADITAAALLAPLFGPDQHPIYSRPDFRAGMAPLIEEWNERPGARWLREMYRRHRR